MSAASRLPSPAPHDGPHPARGAGPWVWAGGSGAFAAVLIASVSAGWQPLLDLDAAVARSLHDSAVTHPGWTGTARVFTDWVWDTFTMRALIVVAALVLWRRGERRTALLLAVTTLVGAVVQQGLKAALDRERPSWEEPVDAARYAAMPSGHAMTAALVCGLLVWLAWSRLRWASARWAVTAAALVSVAGVSLTRLYLGVHWLTDVVVGVALGIALAALAALTAGHWQARRRSARITP